MRVAIIGATGYVGAAITEEALRRGHDVTGIVRTVGRLPAHPHLEPRALDVHDVPALTAALSGHPVAVHAFSPGRAHVTDPDIFERFAAGHRAILAAAARAGVPRLLCVGGAASLLTREGVPLLDSQEFPAQFEPARDAIMGTRELYYLLQKSRELDWVFLAPACFLVADERRGRYRTDRQHLLYDADGVSRVGLADYAAAMLDELERPAHHRERFTVGY
jgi:uncharacterized protein